MFAMEFFTNVFTTTIWSIDRRLLDRMCVFYLFFFMRFLVGNVQCANERNNSKEVTDRQYCKIEMDSNQLGRKDLKELGLYGQNSRVNFDAPITGQLVHVQTLQDKSHLGCGQLDPAVVPSRGKWIALVQRGSCNFNKKIYYAAKVSNASAVIIYSYEMENKSKEKMNYIIETKGEKDVSNVVSVYITHQMGQVLLDGLKLEYKVNVTISRTEKPATPTTTTAPNQQFAASNTSVLFVSISFIVLIIISLAWLVFYYIQRCRYTNAKERLSRRLANAAKKAIAKIPQRPVKYGDKELDADADQCAVCIEPYKISDVIRILPCKHVFHKSCVDPWLLDQRSCPMCKMDILRAFGMQLNWSQESVPQDAESGVMNSSPAIEETEHLSTSDEQGAVGGVKIVLYQHPAMHYGEGTSGQYRDLHYAKCGDGDFHDSEGSSDGSLHLCSSPMAQCHVECTSQIVVENSMNNSLKCAIEDEQLELQQRSVSLDSLHISDEEDCNENQSLMTGLLRQGDSVGFGSSSSRSLRRGSETTSSGTNSIKQTLDHDHV